MIVQIEKDGDDYIIPLTEELCKELGWEVGNNLNLEDNDDGSFTLSLLSSASRLKCSSLIGAGLEKYLGETEHSDG